MSAAFTSGPWHVEPDVRAGVYKIRAGYAGEHRTIGEAWDQPDEGEARANAEAFAAVPDMVGALRELVAEYDERNRKAAIEQGCFGIEPTGGIQQAKELLAFLDGGE